MEEKKGKTRIADVGFDDLPGALEVARHLFREKKLSPDGMRTLTMGFTDSSEFVRRIKEEGIEVNHFPLDRGRSR